MLIMQDPAIPLVSSGVPKKCYKNVYSGATCHSGTLEATEVSIYRRMDKKHWWYDSSMQQWNG